MSAITFLAKLTFAATLAAPIASFAIQPVHIWGEVPDTPSVKTRAQVKQELQAFRANPVAADGFRWVGGEMGWVPPAPSYGVVDGKLVGANGNPHADEKPSLHSSAAELAREKRRYSFGS